MRLDPVAVAIDFSHSSRAALKMARRLTLAREGSSIRLIHVIDSALFRRGPTYGDPAVAESVFADLIRGARLELDNFAAEELREAGVPVETVIKVGRPADVLLAASEGAGILIVGTHGRGFAGRLLLGSVAEEVVRRSAIPTLVARERPQEPVARVLLAIDPMGPSRDAVQFGAILAEHLGAELEAIHAAYLPPVLPYADKGDFLKLTDALEHHMESAPELLRKLVQETLGHPIKVHVVAGPPADEIARFAGLNDVVVCGTHGRSALGRLAFGSVATKLIRTAPCSVVVVRPTEDESSCRAEGSKHEAGALTEQSA